MSRYTILYLTLLAGVLQLVFVGCSPEESVVDNTPEKKDTVVTVVPELIPIRDGDLIINEVCIGNSGNLLDEYGKDPDWIELYNRGEDAVSLEGYALSDDSTQLMKWKAHTPPG